MKTLNLALCLLLALVSGSWSPLAPLGGGPAQEDAERQAALEAEFAELMTGVTMLGHFTLDDAPDVEPQEEAYRLGKVEKLGGTKWRFEAQIEYGGKTNKLPLVLDVLWAGDTPVITLTDMAIPLMGTFTSRVVIYGNQYAGIWSGGDHGGQMYGRLIPAGEAPEEESTGGADGED